MRGDIEMLRHSTKFACIMLLIAFLAVTSGSDNTCHVGASYNSLRIQRYVYGSTGLGKGLTHSPDDCVFPNVSVEGETA